MAGRTLRAFKSDESFLEKISIGAIGTKRVFEDLARQGHRPIELERGSMSFKIWKAIKIKRLRVPDILCVNCGTRIESRAKTKLEVTMSHSHSQAERGWDFGLNDKDYVALVVCHKKGDSPIDWVANDQVQYVSVHDLRKAIRDGKTVDEKPKGAEEGFEARITWPCSVASADGVVTQVRPGRLQFKRKSDERTITVSLRKKKVPLSPLVRKGDTTLRHQIIASVVPVFRQIECPGGWTAQSYGKLLLSPSITERYTAVKALSCFGLEKMAPKLKSLVNDTREHIYVRLEAAATLMRSGFKEGISFIDNCLRDSYLENRLEAVIILGEIQSKEARSILTNCLLDKDQRPEIRAGAAWSMGEQGARDALDPLIESFLSMEVSIRVEAARALAKLARRYRQQVLSRFPDSSPKQRPGLAWAISKAGGLSVAELMPSLANEDARQWVTYIIGTQTPKNYVSEIEELKSRDPEVYFAVTVLWKIMSSWIYGLEEY